MKRMAKWKSFDFGSETSVDENKSPSKSPQKKRKSLDNSSKSQNLFNGKEATKKCNFDFHKVIEPKSPADLIVHAKKIQEIEGWLKTVSNNTKQLSTQFLLITGPTGSGKTTTVQILCKSMNIDIAEWTNTVDIDFEVLRGPGQLAKFLDFFTESKYCSLFSKGNTKKVLIVKDFPNIFLKNPQEFLNILEDVSFKASHPVIFICTDSSSSDINLQRILFPEEVLLKYFITTFSFNVCAPTLLKKGLKRAVDILRSYPEMFHAPSQASIDAILVSSMGDIRCAMNQLYLACVNGHQDLPVVKSRNDKSGSKRKRQDQTATIKHMTKDETLGLFHGLGRVLNPKRNEQGNSWRLSCDIQKLIDEFSIQPSKFASFLFENYLKYFGDFEDIQKSSEMLSFSVRLLENWENRDTLVIALWVSVMGLMVFNEHKVSKWNQIKGPRKLNKACSSEDELRLHPTDRFYYNLITRSDRYHKFNYC